MKPMSIAGVVLLVLGLVALVYQGVNYTSRDTVVEIGSLKMTADTQKTLPLSPLLGIAAVVGGVGLMVVGGRKAA